MSKIRDYILFMSIDNIIILMFGIAVPILFISITVGIIVKFAKTKLFQDIDKYVTELIEQLSILIVAYIVFYPIVYIVLIHHVFLEKRDDRKAMDFFLFFGVHTPLIMIYVGCALYIVEYFIQFF